MALGHVMEQMMLKMKRITPIDEGTLRASMFVSGPDWHGDELEGAWVAGGPAANFLLSIVIFALTVMIVGRVVTAPIVDKIRPDSAAAVAGFTVGDYIKKIEEVVGAPIDIISTGPDRVETIVLRHPFGG